VIIEGGCEVVGAGDGALVLRGGRTTAKFDLVIDALGVRSPLSRAQPLPPLPFGALWGSLDWPAGNAFDATALEQRYEAARRMVGVLPIGSVRPGAPRQAAFFWSLRHADLAAWQAGGLDAWKADVMQLWPQTAPFLEQVALREQLIFASYCHGTLRSPLKDGIVHIGDSWHSASPQLGQGANMALLDALALSRSMVIHANTYVAMGAYARARLGHIRIYQLASWMFTPPTRAMAQPWRGCATGCWRPSRRSGRRRKSLPRLWPAWSGLPWPRSTPSGMADGPSQRGGRAVKVGA